MKTSLPIHSVDIPSKVRFDTRLSASAKLLYGEIAYLSQEQGCCLLNEPYFAELYQVTIRTATAWIARLEKAGYLYIRYDASGRRRLLYLESLEASKEQVLLISTP